MLGRSVTFGPKSVEKCFQQQNFFELTTPNVSKMQSWLLFVLVNMQLHQHIPSSVEIVMC